MEKFRSPKADELADLPRFKRDFIEWLQGFQFTGGLIRAIKTGHWTPVEVHRLRYNLAGTLIPIEKEFP